MKEIILGACCTCIVTEAGGKVMKEPNNPKQNKKNRKEEGRWSERCKGIITVGKREPQNKGRDRKH